MPDCDALITDKGKYLLTITVADCLPVYFYDQKKKVVAIAHAGWRGVVSKIAAAVISAFVKNYGSTPSDLEVFIGPHIRDCHFEVKADVASQFESSDLVLRGGKTYIDLAGAVRKQLVGSGVSDLNIRVSSECTSCLNKKYFSFRRDKPQELETMIAYIGLR